MNDNLIKIAGIILSAGLSKRFKNGNKLIIKLENKPIINHVIENALSSNLDKVYLVLGHNKDNLLSVIDKKFIQKLTILFNSDYEKGISTSLRCGVNNAYNEGFRNFMFLMGDMPFITKELINLIIMRYKESIYSICFPIINGKKGHPTIIGEKYLKELNLINGDCGGINIIKDNWEESEKVVIDDEKSQIDIDTLEDYKKYLDKL